MLLTDFYKLESISKGADHYTCVIKLNPDHPVYKGHFPDHPVTPGVCMMSIIKECASEALQQTLRYSQVHSCKFLSVVNPQEQSVLDLSFSVSEQRDIQVILSAGEKQVLRLKASLTPVL